MISNRITPMNILIIDDQAIVRRTLHRYIEDRGDTAYMAENGHAGLAIANLESRPHQMELLTSSISRRA